MMAVGVLSDDRTRYEKGVQVRALSAGGVRFVFSGTGGRCTVRAELQQGGVAQRA